MVLEREFDILFILVRLEIVFILLYDIFMLNFNIVYLLVSIFIRIVDGELLLWLLYWFMIFDFVLGLKVKVFFMVRVVKFLL